ncbi:hypothetical protein FB451DRAFT_1275115 [Mycena latifolia]|nr:hypothetical protein FB451DRAFT_1275115 [Mycena latifolia]
MHCLRPSCCGLRTTLPRRVRLESSTTHSRTPSGPRARTHDSPPRFRPSLLRAGTREMRAQAKYVFGLERNFSSLADSQAQPVHSQPQIKRLPSTFRPERLRPSDFYEALPYPFTKFYYIPKPQDAETSVRDQHIGASIAWFNEIPPESCRGFLYYHSPAPTTPLAGSMRFRLTPDYNPSSGASPAAAFAAGSDLPIPHTGGLPWSVPLWRLGRLPFVRDVLRADGWTVPNGVRVGTAILTECSLALHALGQPFLVEFHMHAVRAWLLPPSPMGPHAARILTGFTDLASKRTRQPYRGFGLMTLERLPDGLLATRLQKILSLSQVCVNENVAQPVEGMTRPLHLAPILFKSAMKPKHRKYAGAEQAVYATVRRLPDFGGL